MLKALKILEFHNIGPVPIPPLEGEYDIGLHIPGPAKRQVSERGCGQSLDVLAWVRAKTFALCLGGGGDKGRQPGSSICTPARALKRLPVAQW